MVLKNNWNSHLTLSDDQVQSIESLIKRRIFDTEKELAFILDIQDFNQLLEIYWKWSKSKEYSPFVQKNALLYIKQYMSKVLSNENDYEKILEYKKNTSKYWLNDILLMLNQKWASILNQHSQSIIWNESDILVLLEYRNKFHNKQRDIHVKCIKIINDENDENKLLKWLQQWLLHKADSIINLLIIKLQNLLQTKIKDIDQYETLVAIYDILNCAHKISPEAKESCSIGLDLVFDQMLQILKPTLSTIKEYDTLKQYKDKSWWAFRKYLETVMVQSIETIVSTTVDMDLLVEYYFDLWQNDYKIKIKERMMDIYMQEMKFDKLIEYINWLSRITHLSKLTSDSELERINIINSKLGTMIQTLEKNEYDIIKLTEYWNALNKINFIDKRYLAKIENRIKQIIAQSKLSVIIQYYNNYIQKYYQWKQFTNQYFKYVHNILVSEFNVAVTSLEPSMENYHLLVDFSENIEKSHYFENIINSIYNAIYSIVVSIYPTIDNAKILRNIIKGIKQKDHNTDYYNILDHLYFNVLNKNWKECNSFETLVENCSNYKYYWWKSDKLYIKLKNYIKKEKNYKLLASYVSYTSPYRYDWKVINRYPYEIYSMIVEHMLFCFESWTIQLDQNDIDTMIKRIDNHCWFLNVFTESTEVNKDEIIVTYLMKNYQSWCKDTHLTSK
jgi:hypothetical protein